MRRCDVIVVGAGVMGTAVAWELSRQGRHVVTLERHEYLHTRGSSHGATRVFRLSDRDPTLVAMAKAALPLWRELEEDAGAEVLLPTGGIDHGDIDDLRAVAAALDGEGVRYQVVQAEDAAERWPGMRFDGPVVHQPDGGRILSEAALRAFTTAAAGHGAEVYYQTPVLEMDDTDEGVVVVTDFEEFVGRVVVVAAGAWAGAVLGGAGPLPSLPIQVTQEQTFHFLPRTDGLSWPSFVHYGAPARYGLETPEEGIKVAEHGTGAVVDPDARDGEIDAAGEERVVRYVEEWLPGLETWATTASTCLYATTPDDRFVVERTGAVVVAAGFSGHGFKHAPVVARHVAALSTQEA